MFAVDGGKVVGLDPASPTPKFTAAPSEQNVASGNGNCGEYAPYQKSAPSEVSGPAIIAGDGYAYYPYTYFLQPLASNQKQCFPSGGTGTVTEIITSHREVHSGLLRVGTDGSELEIPIGSWTEDTSMECVEGEGDLPVEGECPGGYQPMVTSGALPLGSISGSLITNADQGVTYAWQLCLDDGSPCTYKLTPITNGGVGAAASTQVQLQPLLQQTDSSYVGFVGGAMGGFDQSGNVRWSAGKYVPLAATADGGAIGQSYDGSTTVAFDSNGNATGQGLPSGTGSMLSWRGTSSYQSASGAVTSTPVAAPVYAPTYSATNGGNLSGGQTAILAAMSNAPTPGSPEKQLPPDGAQLHRNYNAIEILTTASPAAIFSTYLQTFAGAGANPPDANPIAVITAVSPALPISQTGQDITFRLKVFKDYAPCLAGGLLPCPMQGPFSVQTERVDSNANTISVVTLVGHPLAGWRYWRVYSIGTNDVVIETGAVDTYAGPGLLHWGNYLGYFVAHQDQLDMWAADLRYILSDMRRITGLDPSATQGTTGQYNVVNGGWDTSQVPPQNYILNQVCQSTHCD
jgi:hypothetical protein